MNFKKLSIVVLLSVICFASCKKIDPPTLNTPVTTPAVGEYILSEGSFNGNNTKLSFYTNNTSNFTGDFFLQQNPTITSGLGDTGNDMIIYGSKLYIIMNESSLVTVLKANDAKFIKNIPFGTVNLKKRPRYAASSNGKVYVSSSDGTVSIIDTSSLTIISNIVVGSNPEQLAVSGEKLFVANSGGYNFPNYDSTVSVINLATNTQIKKIKVGLNPRKIVADKSGNLYVVVTGNYGNVTPKIVKINALTETVTFSADTAVNTIFYFDNKLYVTSDNANISTSNVRVLNTFNFANIKSNFITDGTQIQTPYGLDINEFSREVFVTDAKNFVNSGEIFCFDENGKKKFSIFVTPGINPNKTLFLF